MLILSLLGWRTKITKLNKDFMSPILTTKFLVYVVDI